MKKLILSLFAIPLALSLTQCNKPEPASLCSDQTTRVGLISVLTNTDGYCKEVMDSMRTKHADVLLANVLAVAKTDTAIQAKLMNSMMASCMTDSVSCKMMMGKCLDMCVTDQSKCMMMMDAMQSHPSVANCAKGSCTMTGMKMGTK